MSVKKEIALKMSDKKYDILKWVATIILPAFITMLIAIFSAWDMPYIEPITATLTAINVFIGAVVQKSSKSYQQTQVTEDE